MAYIGYIYRFRNAKNGKSYIGKTNNPKMRINSHRTHTPGVDARHIGSCCRGNRKTAGGFVWKYKEGGEYAS